VITTSKPHINPEEQGIFIGLSWVMSGYPVAEGNLKSPDHCDRAGSSPAPGTNNNTLKPKVPANIISNDIGC
jgi:hypothetical protein